MKRPAFLGSKKQTGTPVSMAETVTITGSAGKSTTTGVRALKADTAVMLVERTEMTVIEAVERCDTSAAYFSAMKALRESGNSTLYRSVLRGNSSVLVSARRVENAAAAITAYEKCSPLERELFWDATGATADAVTLLRNLGADQLVAASKALGLDWVWDRMIAAAMSTEAST